MVEDLIPSREAPFRQTVLGWKMIQKRNGMVMRIDRTGSVTATANRDDEYGEMIFWLSVSGQCGLEHPAVNKIEVQLEGLSSEFSEFFTR